jgi:hypothetical protein
LRALMRRASFWVASILLVLPIVAYFAPSRINWQMAKLWPPENHIWLMFAGALLVAWAAFRVWDEQRELIAELRLQLARREGRHLTSEQRVALVTALKESDEPIRINIVYNHLDAEAEAYAAEFSAVLLPLRFAGAPIPVSDIPDGLGSVVIRVNSESVPPLAQRLSNALTGAKIDHRTERLTGERALLAPSNYFDLAIGRMRRGGN